MREDDVEMLRDQWLRELANDNAAAADERLVELFRAEAMALDQMRARELNAFRAYAAVQSSNDDRADEQLVEQLRAEASAIARRRAREADELRLGAGVRPKKPRPRSRSTRRVRLHPIGSEQSFFDEIALRTAGSGIVGDLLQRVVDMWIVATDYDLTYARRFWDSGVNPLNSVGVDLISNGMRPDELALKFDGRTVLDHLTAGMTVRECQRHLLVARLTQQSSGPSARARH